MNFRTSSYFFPSNRHRIKSELRDSPLHSIQRREIKENLSSYISTHHQPLLYYPVLKKKKTKSVQESRNTSCKKMRMEQTANKQSSNNNLGIYKILQKVKVLKEEESELETNPFYKIQKYRKNSKLAQFSLKRKQEIKPKMEQLEKIENEPLKIEPKLFQNEGLWEINEEKPAKIRNKSQTVMYYEIKHYYEKKYGRSPSLA